MAYAPVEKPIPFPEAFQEEGEAAILSQAAVLLLLGAQLRSEERRKSDRTETPKGQQAPITIPEEDLAELKVPKLSASNRRFKFSGVRSSLLERHGPQAMQALGGKDPRSVVKLLPDLSLRLARKRDRASAAQMMEVCLQHPAEPVRVAAAAAYFELVKDDPGRLVEILERGTALRVQCDMANDRRTSCRTSPRACLGLAR